MDAKPMVATDGDDVIKLKDLLNQEDATAMVVVTATSKKPPEEDQPPAGNIINPLLLASARAGSWEALNLLLEREDAKKPPMMVPTRKFLQLIARGSSAQGRIPVSAAGDVEEGVDHQPVSSLATGALLKGVTPQGDTALHMATIGGQNYLKYAGIICDRDKRILFAKNHKGDTPLHCAVRAGQPRMVSYLIHLAAREGADTKLRLLRTENNHHETALHQAVRFQYDTHLRSKEKASIGESRGDAEATPEERNIVKLLMGADAELANYPADGVSPLYLAILLWRSTTALILYDMSAGNLSYSGPDGQNALHVAIIRDRVMVEFLVHWNRSLTTQVDKHGSTPLHFAASLYIGWELRFKLLCTPPWCHVEWFSSGSKALNVVFDANPMALYQADKDGYFPIHVAASVGIKDAIQLFHNEYPDSAGLCDAKGRTFLHVAVNKNNLHIVSYVCGTKSLAWILNMQDNDGNTALHLAIEARDFKIFCALFGCPWVNLNLVNNQGETLRDLAGSKVSRGINYTENPEYKIHDVIWRVAGSRGALRGDKLNERYMNTVNLGDEDKESQMLGNSAQALIIASVLIATVAFAATFSLPGGYRADDHINGGTPTHAGSYVFDAFMMATTLAFICSIGATIGFAFAAVPLVSLISRRINLATSTIFMFSSVTCLSIAFALGVYVVLAPVILSTAIAVCVITPAILLSANIIEAVMKFVTLARALCIRKGLFVGMVQVLRMYLQIVVIALWPFIVIFGWAALASIHRRHKS